MDLVIYTWCVSWEVRESQKFQVRLFGLSPPTAQYFGVDRAPSTFTRLVNLCHLEMKTPMNLKSSQWRCQEIEVYPTRFTCYAHSMYMI